MIIHWFLIIGIFITAFIVSYVMRKLPKRKTSIPLKIKIICFLLAIGFFITSAVITFTDLSKLYSSADTVSKKKVRVNSYPPLFPSSALPQDPPSKEIESIRLLIHLVVSDLIPETLPSHIQEIELNWPQDRNRTFDYKFEIDGDSIELKFSVLSIHTSDDNTHISSNVRYSIKQKVFLSWTDISGSRNLNNLSTPVLCQINIKRQKTLFSLQNRNTSSQHMILFYTTVVSKDDPLDRYVSYTEFIESIIDPTTNRYAKLLKQSVLGGILAIKSSEHKLITRIQLYINHFGINAVILITVCILLWYIFSKPVSVVIVILFTVAIDKVSLGKHISHLNNPSTSIAVKSIACEQISNTFFYRKTAFKELKNLMEDTQISKELRDYCDLLISARLKK